MDSVHNIGCLVAEIAVVALHRNVPGDTGIHGVLHPTGAVFLGTAEDHSQLGFAVLIQQEGDGNILITGNLLIAENAKLGEVGGNELGEVVIYRTAEAVTVAGGGPAGIVASAAGALVLS